MQRSLLPDRWQRIIDFVESRGEVTVRELCEELGVSPNTARRDLEHIQSRGLIIKTHGRVAPCKSLPLRTGNSLAESRRINPHQKMLIGKAAAELVRPGETVIMDGGFTTFQVAQHFTAENLHVITTSLDVARALAERECYEITLVGGELSPKSGCVIGWVAVEQINRLNADKAILGNDAISVKEGLSCVYPPFAQLKKVMSDRAKELIVVADHLKIGRFAKYTWGEINSLSTLVTDSQADPNTIARLRDAGVKVIVAEDDGE